MPGFEEALKAALTQDEAQGEAAPAATEQESASAGAPAGTAPTTQDVAGESSGRVRDETGRFAKQEATPVAQPKGATPAPKPAQGQQTQSAKPTAQEAAPAAQEGGNAPRSWAPAVREHWNVLPRPVKDQILKREGEASRAVAEAGQARKFQQEFEAVAAPYKALFTAPPVQVAANLFQTAAALQTGDIPTKAGIIAQMIRNFGVPPDAVADAWDGKQPAAQAQPQSQQYRDPRVDDILRRQQMAEQQGQQAQVAQAHQQLEAFMANAEFVQDVWQDMAALLETGRASTYDEAYRKACAMNEEVATVMAQRKAQDAQRAQSQQVQQARHAAGSVKSDPAPPAGSRKPSFDEALAAAVRGGR